MKHQIVSFIPAKEMKNSVTNHKVLEIFKRLVYFGKNITIYIKLRGLQWVSIFKLWKEHKKPYYVVTISNVNFRKQIFKKFSYKSPLIILSILGLIKYTNTCCCIVSLQIFVIIAHKSQSMFYWKSNIVLNLRYAFWECHFESISYFPPDSEVKRTLLSNVTLLLTVWRFFVHANKTSCIGLWTWHITWLNVVKSSLKSSPW